MTTLSKLPNDIFWLICHYISQADAARLARVSRRLYDVFIERAWWQIPDKLLEKDQALARELVLKYDKYVHIINATDVMNTVVPEAYWPRFFPKVRRLIVGNQSGQQGRQQGSNVIPLPLQSLLSEHRLAQFPALGRIDVHYSALSSISIASTVNKLKSIRTLAIMLNFDGGSGRVVQGIRNELDSTKKLVLDVTVSQHLDGITATAFRDLAPHIESLDVTGSAYHNCTHTTNDQLFMNDGKPVAFPQLKRLSVFLGPAPNAGDPIYVPSPSVMPELVGLTVKARSCNTYNHECRNTETVMTALFQPVWKKLQKLQLSSVEESLSLEALVKSVPNATDMNLAYKFPIIPSTPDPKYCYRCEQFTQPPPPPPPPPINPCDIFILIAKLPRLIDLSIKTRGIRAVCTPSFNFNSKCYSYIDNGNSNANLLANSRIMRVSLTGFEYMTSTAFAVIFSLPAVLNVYLKGSFQNLSDIRDITSSMRSVAKATKIDTGRSSQPEMTNIVNAMCPLGSTLVC
ncbi:hypothetical protein GQ42DRAFT_170400 [Ramicandelaber brevisporus]|nr:hypothetical protein GQ42DRAFT_170400 [Ramicandelaber brevisporus]